MSTIDEQRLEELLLRSLEQRTPWTPEGERSEAIQEFVGGFLAGELRRIGCQHIQRDAVGNLLASVRSGTPRHGTTLFVTYAMTHPAGTMADPWRPSALDGAAFGIEGRVVRGRGACEQRGPMAAVLAALATVLAGDTPPAGVQVLALTSGETGTHDAMAIALAELPIAADGAVLAVCTSGDVVRAHKGRVDLEVVVHGQAAHSSSPELADNAVERACEVLAALRRYDLGGTHPELGARTLTPIAIRSAPEATHTVPERCCLTLDHRLLPGDEPETVARAVGAYLDREVGATVALEAGAVMLPSELAPGAPLLRAIRQAARAAGHDEPRVRCMAASTDTGYLVARGVPAVCLGPGDARRAHTDDDVISLGETIRLAELYVALMRQGPVPWQREDPAVSGGMA